MDLKPLAKLLERYDRPALERFHEEEKTSRSPVSSTTAATRCLTPSPRGWRRIMC